MGCIVGIEKEEVEAEEYEINGDEDRESILRIYHYFHELLFYFLYATCPWCCHIPDDDSKYVEVV